jgi:hypothetical protein
MELYQSIYDNTKHLSSPLEDQKKINIIQLIPKLDQKGHDLLFFIIRMYHNHQSQDITFSIPYQSSTNISSKEDIEFDLNVFPNHLQHMIYVFTRMHYDYISYESIRK